MRKALAIFCMFLILGAPMAQTASAQCCNDFWSCAAAVATGGVSCLVQGLINTVQALVTQVTALRNNISTQLQTVAQSAQQELNTAAGQLRSDAENAAALNKQVITQAGQILNAELNPGASSGTATSAGGSSSVGGKTTGASGATSGQSGSGVSAVHGATGVSAGKAASGSSSGQTGGGSPTGAGTTKSGSTTSGAGGGMGTTSANSSAGSTTSSGAGIAVSGATATKSNTITPGQMAANPTDILNAIKAANQFLAQTDSGVQQQLQTVAHQTQIAGQMALNDLQVGINLGNQAALVPLDTMKNYLQGLLANPGEIFDPTSMVDAAMNTVINNLSSTFDQVTNAVVKDASSALQLAQGPLTLLQQQLQTDQAIEAAMSALHTLRNKAALDALNNLVPHSNSGSGATPAQTASSNGGSNAQLTYTSVMATFTATRTNSLTAPKQQLQASTAAIANNIAQLKLIRSQAKSMSSTMPGYQANFGKQLDAYFAGKSAADAAKLRDQLIAQAQSRYANDPKTRDAVIQLLTGESNKRIQVIAAKRP